MKLIRETRLAFVVLLLTTIAQPAVASCASGTILGTDDGSSKSFVWTPTGAWASPEYYSAYPPFVYYAPPVTPDFVGRFWALGTVDPASDVGDDSDTWAVSNWFYYRTYPAYYLYYAGQIVGSWAQSLDIDGCITNNPGGCTSILLNDQDGTTGFVALLTAQHDVSDNTYFDQPGSDGAGNAGPIILSEMDEPVLVQQSGSEFSFLVPAPQGLFIKDGCSTDVSYKVYGKWLPAGSAPPSDRSRAGWTDLTPTPVAVGEIATTIPITCTEPGDEDIYFAASLVFDGASGGGYETDYVSANAPRFTCYDYDQDLDGFPVGVDCDDDNSDVYPGAPQICDGLNNDCDHPLWPAISGPAWTKRVVPTTPAQIYSIHADDVDGDGDQDVLATGFGNDRIVWYDNLAGDGSTWTENVISNSADGAHFVITYDVDGDGDQDVLSASTDDDTVAWHENTAGDGSSWTPHTISTTADYAMGVAAGDVDGDGDVDVLSASYSDHTVAWHENTAGDGTAWSEHDISTAMGGAVFVLAIDMDDDDDLDVVAAGNTADKIAWYENTAGNGSAWTEHTVSAAVDGPKSIFAADLDDDGDLDLLSASASDDKIAWHENTAGDGTTWTEHALSTTADFAESVFAADLDADGDLDAMSASYLDNTVSWYENTAGDASFWTEHEIDTTADSPVFVLAVDLDGDSDLDVMSANYGDSEIAWYENDLGTNESDDDGDGSSECDGDCDDQDPNNWASCAGCVDADTDGWFVGCDAYVTIEGPDCDDGSGAVFPGAPEICDGLNNPCEQPFWPALSGESWADVSISLARNNVSGIYAGDIDGDGDVDALSASHDDDTIAWHENLTGNGTGWAEWVISTDNHSTQTAILADIGGDGVLDVVSGSTPKVAWYEKTAGDGSAWVEHIIVAKGLAAFEVAAADLDGDRDLDVVAASWNYSVVYWYENTLGNGVVWTEHVVGGGGGPTCVSTADVDGDGDEDVLAGLYSADEFVWYDNTQGDGSAWTKRTIGTGVDGLRSVAAADVDGDGDLDTMSASDIDHTVAWYENSSGDGTTWNETVISSTTTSAGTVFPADMDLDGDIDIAATSHADRVVWHENTAGDGTLWAEHVITTDLVQPTSLFLADVDGDGDLDAVTGGSGDEIAWHKRTWGTNESDEDGDGITECEGDCGDYDPNNQTACTSCIDSDGDGAYVGCDAYVTIDGPDCDDTKPGCGDDCTDPDGDGYCLLDDCDPAVTRCNLDCADADVDGTPDCEQGCMDALYGQLAWWPGDGSPTDIRGTNDGVLVGGASFAPGWIGEAFSLDGVDDYVRVPDHPSLNPTTAISVDAWIYRTGQVGSWDPIVRKAESSAGYSLEFLGNEVWFHVYIEGVGWHPSARQAVPLDSWTHVAGTWDGVEIRLYVDGAEVGTPQSAVGVMEVSSSDLGIGSEGTSRIYQGLIDEVGLYSRALSPAEVQAIYDAGSLGVCKDADHDGFNHEADCDESEPDVFPGAPEICDGLNNDCDHPFWPSLTGETWTEAPIALTRDNIQGVYAGDIDQDGDMDVLAASHDDATIAWYQNSGGSWTEWLISTDNASTQSAILADLDNDGYPDPVSADAGKWPGTSTFPGTGPDGRRPSSPEGRSERSKSPRPISTATATWTSWSPRGTTARSTGTRTPWGTEARGSNTSWGPGAVRPASRRRTSTGTGTTMSWPACTALTSSSGTRTAKATAPSGFAGRFRPAWTA